MAVRPLIEDCRNATLPEFMESTMHASGFEPRKRADIGLRLRSRKCPTQVMQPWCAWMDSRLHLQHLSTLMPCSNNGAKAATRTGGNAIWCRNPDADSKGSGERRFHGVGVTTLMPIPRDKSL